MEAVKRGTQQPMRQNTRIPPCFTEYRVSSEAMRLNVRVLAGDGQHLLQRATAGPRVLLHDQHRGGPSSSPLHTDTVYSEIDIKEMIMGRGG